MRKVLKAIKRLIPDRSPIRLLWHHGKAFMAALRYGFPARKLTVIAVTGTDGKTTTVGMIAHILRSSGKSVGAASTAFFRVNDEIQENATHLTSISPWTLQRFLWRLAREKCQYAIIEVSSHGLVQGRANYTWPMVAAVTNTSPEHLDYHGSMEQYRRDKGIIFQLLRKRGVSVLNGGDESYPMYREELSGDVVVWMRVEKDKGDRTMDKGAGSGDSKIADSSGNVDLSLSDVQSETGSCSANIITGLGGSVMLRLNVPGVFNLENALCAIACCQSFGVPLDDCVQALESFAAMPGRLEQIDEGQDFSVYVDFTMTEAAYEKTLQTLRASIGEEGRVLALFGCCGNRMREKRPVIAKVVSSLADVVVAAGDETYGEDPEAVLKEVWAGIDQSACHAKKFVDRREGIAWLLRHARSGDAVVFCGMGPFSTFNTLDGPIPWDERVIVKEELQNMLRG